MTVDKGPLPGPETRRAVLAIVNESRVRRGLPPIGITIRPATESTTEVTDTEAGLLADLRQKWADQPGTEH